MMNEIVTFGHPSLKSKSVNITEFDEALKKLSERMIKIMYEAPGVGLAAPQIGINKNSQEILESVEAILDNNIDKKTNIKDETVNKILEVLDTKIRPAVARDGGDIKFKSFENGVVKVELQGSCSGCPSSLMTLKQGVQNLLKHYVKEVNSVEAI